MKLLPDLANNIRVVLRLRPPYCYLSKGLVCTFLSNCDHVYLFIVHGLVAIDARRPEASTSVRRLSSGKQTSIFLPYSRSVGDLVPRF